MKNLLYLPAQYIPKSNTNAYKVLSLLSDGSEYSKSELMMVLLDDPRSPLQALKGKQYGLSNVLKGGKIVVGETTYSYDGKKFTIL